MALYDKMKHVTSHIKESYYDVKMDLEEIKRSHTGNDYFWFVRNCGTTLIPSPHLFMEGSTYNLMAEKMADLETVKVFFIRIFDIPNGKKTKPESIEGEIRVISNFREIIEDLTRKPKEIHGKIWLKNGDIIQEAISYDKSFFEKFAEHLDVHEKDIERLSIEKIVF